MKWTTLGSLPGTDMPAAARMLFDETPDLVAIPELPARGVGADMVGRTLGLSMLGADLQPAGWRITDHHGADQRRATRLLRQDLDVMEEQAQEFTGVVKLSIAGPWTLAAMVERPRGDKVLADPGLARELTASLVEGVSGLLGELRRRLPGANWCLQLDEPMLGMVLDGGIATASGYQRHRAVGASEAVESLDAFARLADQTVLHFCGAPLTAVLERTTIPQVSVDVTRLNDRHVDLLAPWLESGRGVWWGAVPTWPVDQLGRVDADLDRLMTFLRRMGLAPRAVVDNSVVTPACGLAGWAPSPARQAIIRSRRIAELATEQLLA